MTHSNEGILMRSCHDDKNHKSNMSYLMIFINWIIWSTRTANFNGFQSWSFPVNTLWWLKIVFNKRKFRYWWKKGGGHYSAKRTVYWLTYSCSRQNSMHSMYSILTLIDFVFVVLWKCSSAFGATENEMLFLFNILESQFNFHEIPNVT